MLADVKEQMKDNKASQIDWKLVALNRENAICEQEALKQLNEQLQTQIVALQNTHTPTQSKNGTGIEKSPDI